MPFHAFGPSLSSLNRLVKLIKRSSQESKKNQYVIPVNVFTDNSGGEIIRNDSVIINGNQSVPVQSIFGWIIWMRRVASVISNATYDWNLPWISYKNGFGSETNNNYWFGLEKVHLMTRFSQYRLRIEVKARLTQEWRSVEYWSFGIGDEASTQYQLNVDGYVKVLRTGLYSQRCN